MSTITAHGDVRSDTDWDIGWQDRLRVNLPRVIRSEWIKFWSLRSSLITLAAAAVVFVGIGLLAASVAGDGGVGQGGPGPGGPGAPTDPTGLSLAGTTFAQLILSTLGVLFMATEYTTGMIRSTLAAVPKRLPMLLAKIVVFVAVVIVVSEAASFVAFLGGQAIIGSGGASLSDPGVLRAVLGTGAYLTGVGLLGLALGALLRSTAAAVSTLVAVMFLLPGIATILLPESWNQHTAYLPSQAGGAFTAVSQTANQLQPWAGLAVFAGYLIAVIAVAAWQLKTRDARYPVAGVPAHEWRGDSPASTGNLARGALDSRWTFQPRTRWKTMSANTPTAPIAETSTRRADAAPAPTNPSATLVLPTPLPKAGAPSMATPRAMRPMGRTKSPVTSNASKMPWVACHISTSVA